MLSYVKLLTVDATKPLIPYFFYKCDVILNNPVQYNFLYIHVVTKLADSLKVSALKFSFIFSQSQTVKMEKNEFCLFMDGFASKKYP